MRVSLALALALPLAAVATAAHAAVTTPRACVLTLGSAMGAPWESLLSTYGMRVDGVPVSDATPRALEDCDLLVVTPDSALFWRARPEAVTELLGERPVLAIGAAVAPVLARRAAGLAEPIATDAAGSLTLEAGLGALLDEPYAVALDGREGELTVSRDARRLSALPADVARPRALAVYATSGGAPVVFRAAATTAWGIDATPDELTAAGRTLLANLAHDLAPSPPPAAERAPSAREEPVREQPDAPVRVIDAARAERAPEIRFSATANGAARGVRSMRGDVTIVVFWATWCGPCRRAMPGVVEIARELDREGIEVVGVSVDDDAADAIEHARRSGYRMPIAVAGPGAQKRFGLSGIPSAVLLDRKGRIRGTYAASDLTASGAVAAARHVAERG